MKSKHTNNLKKITILILLVPMTLLSQQLDQQKYNYEAYKHIDCIFPLEIDNSWEYDIYYNGKKSGTLSVKVIKKYEIESKFSNTYKLKVYTLKFNDSFKKKKYEKDIMADWRNYYIYNGKGNTSYPFLSSYLKEGDQLGYLLVTDISKAEFKGQSLYTATLKHLEKKIVEKYMFRTGLYYYKENGLEYKLADAKVDIGESWECSANQE